MKMYLKEIVKSLVILAVVVAGIGIVEAWTGPTATPPGNNVAAPINESAFAQSKAGKLTVSTNPGSNPKGLAVQEGPTFLPGDLSVATPVLASTRNGLKALFMGNIGAQKYCDENGLNCKSITELSNSNSNATSTGGNNSVTVGHDAEIASLPSVTGSGDRQSIGTVATVGCLRYCSMIVNADALLDSDEDSGGGGDLYIQRRYRAGGGAWSAWTNIAVMGGAHHGGSDKSTNFGHDVPLGTSWAGSGNSGEYQYRAVVNLRGKWDVTNGRLSAIAVF